MTVLKHLKPSNLQAQYQMARVMAGLSTDVSRAYAQWMAALALHPGFVMKRSVSLTGDYLGIGAGAHGKLTLPAENRIERRVRSHHPNRYLELAGRADNIDAHDISRQDLPFEFMLNALRLTGGFPVSLFQERTGMPIAVVSKTLRGLEEDGLIEWDIQTVRPTERGLRFLNDVLGRFLPGD